VADEPLTCVVEIPKVIRNKYEYDVELGAIKLDRFLSASVVYPTGYRPASNWSAGVQGRRFRGAPAIAPLGGVS